MKAPKGKGKQGDLPKKLIWKIYKQILPLSLLQFKQPFLPRSLYLHVPILFSTDSTSGELY